MANLLFYYFGDDEAYYKVLSGEFAKHTRLVIDFIRVYESNEKDIQTLFLKVYNDRPSVVFIDFSKNSQDYLHLARLISRSQLESPTVLVGLVDYLSPPELLPESLVTGVQLSYIKSAETFDVVYDITRFIAPKECSSHGFAKAETELAWEVGAPCKVGYITQEGLHLETDFKLDVGSKVSINHHWLGPRLIPSREVFVKALNKENLFYQYKYAYDLSFLFADEIIQTDGMDIDVYLGRQADRDDAIKFAKKQLNKWLDDNQLNSKEKNTKLLVIDRDFHFYNDRPRSDKHPYTIRCLAYLGEMGEDLLKHSPQAIVYNIQKPSPDLKKDPRYLYKNTVENLEQLTKVIKAKYSENKPILIVFNAEEDSRTMQERLGYEQLITYPGELTVEIVITMADMLQNRQKKILLDAAEGPKKIFIDKTTSLSTSEIVISIKIIKMSESDLVFRTEQELPYPINLRVRSPVNMYLRVLTTSGDGKKPEYIGLIHGISESGKKELRRYINSQFFKDHDAQIQAEFEEYKKLNELKLQQKIKLEEEKNKANLEKNNSSIDAKDKKGDQ